VPLTCSSIPRAMPRKQTATRKRAVLLPPPQSWYSSTAISSTSSRDEDDQLAKGILASKASSMQNDTYTNALACALDLSEVEAKQEAEEAEAFRLAVAASLADAEEKGLGLGLKIAASPQAHCLLQNVSFPGPSLDLAMPPGSCALDVPFSESIASCSLARAVLETPPTDTTLSRILKVTYDQDTRRLHTRWLSGARPRNILTCIQETIEESFGLPSNSAEPPAYFLKYLDDEGDLCTLVEHTLTDFLGTSIQGSPLKIFLRKGQEQGPQKMELRGLEEIGRSCDVQRMQDIEVAGWDCGCLQDIQNTANVKLSTLEDFSIATPPSTPRNDSPTGCSETIEDDYDSAWSLIGLEK